MQNLNRFLKDSWIYHLITHWAAFKIKVYYHKTEYVGG